MRGRKEVKPEGGKRIFKGKRSKVRCSHTWTQTNPLMEATEFICEVCGVWGIRREEVFRIDRKSLDWEKVMVADLSHQLPPKDVLKKP
jgi:hypothetical protein